MNVSIDQGIPCCHYFFWEVNELEIAYLTFYGLDKILSIVNIETTEIRRVYLELKYPKNSFTEIFFVNNILLLKEKANNNVPFVRQMKCI